MADLEAPDRHHLSATVGWLELGNPVEAQKEWDRISPAHREHPDVLEAQWQICAATKLWAPALEVARQQVQCAPNLPAGWINQSYALHEMKRTQEAFDALAPVARRFRKLSIVHYNLACYACQLGRLHVAKKKLATAMKLRGQDEIKQMALADADLKPLWDYLKALPATPIRGR